MLPAIILSGPQFVAPTRTRNRPVQYIEYIESGLSASRDPDQIQTVRSETSRDPDQIQTARPETFLTGMKDISEVEEKAFMSSFNIYQEASCRKGGGVGRPGRVTPTPSASHYSISQRGPLI
jgi:hypothetical protein